MFLPCQLVQWYLMPALTAEMAAELKKRGLSQRKIAECLEITPAAVSQYLSKKRGRRGVKLDAAARKDVAQLASKLEKMGKVEKVRAFCRLCAKAREAGALCSVHRGLADVPGKCSLCHKIKC